MTKQHPLDGYDYVADVPLGTPLLVASPDGRVWRLAKKGIRYHEDVRTRLHGAAPARPPPAVAASDRIRAILEAVASGRGALPPGLLPVPVASWTDAPRHAGSLAPTATLTLYEGGWVRAWIPRYDDEAHVGARLLTARERTALERDLAAAPRGVRLPVVSIRPRTVRVTAAHPRYAEASSIEGARPALFREVYASEAGYAEALAAPDARPTYSGGPVRIPDPGTPWDVPLAEWRRRSEE